jgi:carbon monoxide dehydrogenase subunit G
MVITGERLLSVDRATAWNALNDVQVLQASIPGCESLVATGAGTYELAIEAAIGPVKARFKGHIALTDVEAPHRYTLRFEGQGGAAGFARGEAKVSLDEQGSQQSLLRYAVNAQVGGRLAQIGSRLIDPAAGAMAEQFFAAFSNHLQAGGVGAGAVPIGPTKISFWSLLKAFLRRLFRGSGS